MSNDHICSDINISFFTCLFLYMKIYEYTSFLHTEMLQTNFFKFLQTNLSSWKIGSNESSQISWRFSLCPISNACFTRECMFFNWKKKSRHKNTLHYQYRGCIRPREASSQGSISRDIDDVHDDVFEWKHFPRYWPFVRGIHRSPVNSPNKGQWREALMFSLICAWINNWVNNREAGGLRSHRAHCDVNVMFPE